MGMIVRALCLTGPLGDSDEVIGPTHLEPGLARATRLVHVAGLSAPPSLSSCVQILWACRLDPNSQVPLCCCFAFTSVPGLPASPPLKPLL